VFSKYKTIKIIPVFGLLVIIVSACGGGESSNPEPPPTVPIGVVSGNVVIGPVNSAAVRIYEIKNDIPNADTSPVFTRVLIKKYDSLTDSNGHYSVPLQIDTAETPILVCAIGGTYIEPASPSNNIITKDLTGELCSVAIFKRGKDMSVHITPFSHIAYGFAKGKLGGGSELLDKIKPSNQGTTQKVTLGAITSSNKVISDWIQLQNTSTLNQGVISVKPLSIGVPSNNEGNILRPGLKYGFALSALSSLVDWVRFEQTGVKDKIFTGLSSFDYAEQLYLDIIDNGKLDGFGAGGTKLKLGGWILSEHIIRHHFAVKIYSVAADPDLNHLGDGIGVAAIRDFAQKVNTNANPDLPNTITNHSVLFASGPQAINDITPIISHGYPKEGDVISGKVFVSVDVIDISGISSVDLTILENLPVNSTATAKEIRPRETALDPIKPVWTIDTTAVVGGIADGVYAFEFTAKNQVGKQTTKLFRNIKISNSQLQVAITNPKVISESTTNPDNAINNISVYTATVIDNFFYDTVNDPDGRNQPLTDFISFKILDSNQIPIVNLPLANNVTINGQVVPSFSQLNPTKRKYNTGVIQELIPGSTITTPLIDGFYTLRVDAMSGVPEILACNPPLCDPPVLARPPLRNFDEVNFLLDTTKPTAVFKASQNGQVFTGPVTISGIFSDPEVGAAKIKSGLLNRQLIEVANRSITEFPAPTGTASTQTNFDVTFTGTPGWTSYEILAVDKAGNISSTTTPIRIGFDATKPTVIIQNKQGIKNLWYSTLNIRTIINDVGTGLFEIEEGINVDPAVPGAIGKAIPFTLEATNVSYLSRTIESSINPKLADGVIKYTVRAKDYAFSKDPTHIVWDTVNFIGIDRKAPTFLVYALSQPDATKQPPALPIRSIDINCPRCSRSSTGVNSFTVDITGNSATVFLGNYMYVQENGYAALSGGNLNLNATSSGIATIDVANANGPPTQPNISPSSTYVPVTGSVVVSLPQKILHGTIHTERAYSVRKYCDLGATQIITILGKAECKTATGGPIPTKYDWIATGIIGNIDKSNDSLLSSVPITKVATSSVVAADSSTPKNIGTQLVCYGVRATNRLTTTLRNTAQIKLDLTSPLIAPTIPGLNDPSTNTTAVNGVGSNCVTQPVLALTLGIAIPKPCTWSGPTSTSDKVQDARIQSQPGSTGAAALLNTNHSLEVVTFEPSAAGGTCPVTF